MGPDFFSPDCHLLAYSDLKTSHSCKILAGVGQDQPAASHFRFESFSPDLYFIFVFPVLLCKLSSVLLMLVLRPVFSTTVIALIGFSCVTFPGVFKPYPCSRVLCLIELCAWLYLRTLDFAYSKVGILCFLTTVVSGLKNLFRGLALAITLLIIMLLVIKTVINSTYKRVCQCQTWKAWT